MRKIAIIHFQPIELYPPVTNLLECMKPQVENEKCLVFTRRQRKVVEYNSNSHSIKIFRFADSEVAGGVAVRLFSYMQFYLFTLYYLVRLRPDKILYYETISFMPVYLYQLIGKYLGEKLEIYCHYHEYNTKEEYQSGMVLNAWLHAREKLLYEKYIWISHTNEDRLDLFCRDYALKGGNLHIMPNYPPGNWYSNVDVKIGDPVKFILIGVADCSSMYIREFTDWIVSLKGRAVWDIYSFSIDDLTTSYLTSQGLGLVRIFSGISYYSLPEILRQYNIGVILYNGHIKNYIYNAPNKFFEYYSCGLDVWFSSDLLGMKKFATDDTYPSVIEVDFRRISDYNFDTLVSHAGKKYKREKFTSEIAFQELFSKLMK